MSFSLSIGDVMMLSQLAWKIGCAFTSGRAGAPAEFQEVENELTSLTRSLTLLADTLDKDDSIMARADEKTKEGLGKILQCCRHTLDSLDSFVDAYQELRKPDGSDALPAQRSWKRVLIKNYKKIWWTTEEGDIQALRNMLQVHVNSISLTMEALQSKSLARLENTIEPMAEKVDDMYDKLNGDLNIKISEMHHLMLSLSSMEASPQIWASGSDSWISPGQSPLIEPKKSRMNSTHLPIMKPTREPSNSQYCQTPEDTPELVGSECWSRSEQVKSMSSRDSDLDGRESGLIPLEYQYPIRSIQEPPPQYERGRGSPGNSPRMTRPADINAARRPSNRSSGSMSPMQTMLPPPAISTELDQPHSRTENYSFMLTTAHPLATLEGTNTTASEQALFEKAIFDDSMILCEVQATSIEYTQPDEGKQGEFRMVEAVSDCKVSVVTKRQKLSTGENRFVTSIWALSDDRSVRLQQELADNEQVVPYTVWGNTSKVVLRVPTNLRFHSRAPDAAPTRIASTSWLNYNFPSTTASTHFQNALMGKTLLLSVKTKRTMRIHDGLVAGTFAYQEQLCGLENLRVWQDHETEAVVALVHYSATFRDGYLAFYLNSARDPPLVPSAQANARPETPLHVPDAIGGGKDADAGWDSSAREKTETRLVRARCAGRGGLGAEERRGMACE
ncbi:hypothetical protein LPUS_10090 [Lasallia pustulata]|uniref:Fungal N-terminal domain-containing protein n=1 Tax=Lasallia pustulata TaxID=136370 RepID=A0A1W5D958_9LECA|nr:hypothetical protein LPUS_10090 [Lasallia pustulata]